MPSQFNVIAFDCDGVMFDTAASNRAYYNAMLEHLGMPEMTAEQFSYAHTHSVKDSVAYLVVDNDRIKRAHQFRETMPYDPFISKMVIEPFLIPLLKKLRSRYHTAIATNRTDTMGKVLTEFGIDRYFDYVVCASDVTHPKPHPEALEKIIQRFDIQPPALLYIGDSEVDEKAAKGAGVTFAAYDNSPLSADYHISNLGELEKLLFADRS